MAALQSDPATIMVSKLLHPGDVRAPIRATSLANSSAGGIQSDESTSCTFNPGRSVSVVRILICLLLFVVPLQLSYAAAAGYCGHKDSSSHFGHHKHQHKQANGDVKSAPAQGGDDLDCGLCQFGCGHFVFTAPVVAQIAVPALTLSPLGYLLRSIVLLEPTRPPRSTSIA